MNLSIDEAELDLGFANPLIQDRPSILIGRVALGVEEMRRLGGSAARELFVFGAKAPLPPDPRFGDSWRNEFSVIETPAGETMREHRLAQRGATMFLAQGEAGRYDMVDMLAREDIRFLHRRPNWKASDASIPRGEGGLYHFARQFYVRETTSAREYFGAGSAVYVFVESRPDDRLSVQLFVQDMSEQTAEEHYRLEAMMAEFDRHRDDGEKTQKLIREGDRHFHAYVMDHPRVQRETLEYLLKHVGSKR
ncbi:hypothetical protein [Lysobacter sp. CA199]|uniref:hypothetical protein n=1 Tax=Lysobacter sp. CA199 TaxID=3455608 RepID=UPI003F8D3AC0